MEIPKSHRSKQPLSLLKQVTMMNTVGFLKHFLILPLLVLLLAIFFPQPGFSQEDDKSKSSSDQKDALSEELLNDLIPSGNSSNKNSDKSSPSTSRPETKSSSKTLAEAETSLDFIQLGMRAASTYLREGETGKTTQEVQSNVLLRLDELIQQSEQQSAQKKRRSTTRQQKRKSQRESREEKREESESTTSGKQQPSDKQKDSQNSERAKEEENSQQQDQDPGDPSKSNEKNPSNAGDLSGENPDGFNEVTAKSADPKSLQQGVWGHLPERIRQQMMSRMVEKFLPQYEASIEEYFRRLSDAERDSDKP